MGSSTFQVLTILFSIVDGIILLMIGFLHFYWAFGGKIGFQSAIPTTSKGEPVMHPRWIESSVVGFMLLIFATYYLLNIGIFSFSLPSWITNYLGWIIASLFLLRAIGDFKYVGFFKKIRNTYFSKMDSRYYAPLCFFIALIGFIVELLK